MCFGVLYPGNLLGLGVDQLARAFFRSSAGGNPIEQLLSGSGYWAYALLAGVLAPVMEELCFRKLLLDRLRTIDKPSALFLSALTFGLFHSNPVQFFYAFGVGLIFGCIYLRTGRVVYTMVLHVLVNFFGGLVSTWMLQFVDLTRPADAILPRAARCRREKDTVAACRVSVRAGRVIHRSFVSPSPRALRSWHRARGKAMRPKSRREPSQQRRGTYLRRRMRTEASSRKGGRKMKAVP